MSNILHRTTFWTHLSPKKILVGDCEHTIKVTHLGKGIYGCRVFVNGELNAENRANGKENIRAACRDLLRWESKLGNISKFADSSRFRNKNDSKNTPHV